MQIRMQERLDGGKVRLDIVALSAAVLRLSDLGQMLDMLDEPRRHYGDLEHVIDEAGGDGAARHAGLGMGVELGLCQRQAAMFLDRPDTDRASLSTPGPGAIAGIKM